MKKVNQGQDFAMKRQQSIQMSEIKAVHLRKVVKILTYLLRHTYLFSEILFLLFYSLII